MKSQYITPALTLFDARRRPDPEANAKLYEHLRRGGVSGFVVMGSSGEFFSLDMRRCKELIDIAAACNKGGMRVFAGASRMDPEESVELANYAHNRGLDGVMIISPYYFPLNDDCIYSFYSFIAERTPAKIFIYNFPARSGYTVSPSLVLKLAERYPTICGIKDTILDMGHTSELILTVKSRLPEFEVYSGFDNNFAHNILAGGDGCIAALSNVVPEFFAGWIRAFNEGKLECITACQRYVDKLMGLYAINDQFIPVLKKALVLRGVVDDDRCSRPFLEITDEQTARVAALLDELHISIQRRE
jgi:4-hydroxy-tetrahydrodipicolinate synthase